MKIRKQLVICTVLALLVGMGIGKLLLTGGSDKGTGDVLEGKVKFWTCSMHPQIKKPGPGKCPICAMNLIPVSENSGGFDLGPTELQLSPRAEKLADIEVAPVVRRFVNSRLRLVGKVEFDETRLSYITAWVPGRLDRLFVDYTGVRVRKGDHLVNLYSPDLLSAQEELIQARKAIESLKDSDLSLVRERADATLKSSREKLRLLGLKAEQIQAVETSGKPTDHVTIYSPMSGIVIHKDALEGMYVQTGTKIYTIADLSKLWVKLDAYESDLFWLHYGQEVEFSPEAFPGEVFTGRISFIDPVLDPQTRTVKVRVNVANTDQKLKPGMFVRATINARITQGGRLFAPDLVGKWISPMHPEIIKDGPGACDICGMDLVKVEEVGFAPPEDEEPPLVIPASAPLITGTRAVVYVQDQKRKGVYQGREIVLGPRAGDHYVVRSGLEEGELVVYNGNFKLDSAVQILAKPSMMSPEEKSPALATIQAPEAFKTQLSAVINAYYAIQAGLAGDQLVSRQAEALTASLEQVDMSLLDEEGHRVWMKQVKRIQGAAKELAVSENVKAAREPFEALSSVMIESVQQVGLASNQTAYVAHCPMAFDNQGASWLQASDQVLNPYFGASMLRCGKISEQIDSVPKAETRDTQGHEHHHEESGHERKP